MRAVLPESQPARPDTLARTLLTRAKKNLNRALAFRIFLHASAILTFSRLPLFSSSGGIEKLVFVIKALTGRWL
jgi:hypothetical protein